MTDYNPNIPAGTQNISQGQVTIQNNFSQLNTIFGFDHYTWDDTSGTPPDAYRGWHKQITFPVNVSATATGTKGVLHTKLGDAAGIFAAAVLPFFANNVADLPMLPDLINTTNDYGFKIGNLIFNLGFRTGALSGTSQTVTWKIPFATILCILPSSDRGSTPVQFSAITLTTCSFTFPTTTNNFYYLAIGK